MKKRNSSGTPGVIERFVRSERSPFTKMLNEVTKWLAESDPDLKEFIVRLLRLAEQHYFEGDIRNALSRTWTAGKALGALASHPAAGKILRRKRKAPTENGKTNAKAAWGRAYQKHIPFRDRKASGQANYLAANYSKDVRDIKHATLEKYCREFKKTTL